MLSTTLLVVDVTRPDRRSGDGRRSARRRPKQPKMATENRSGESHNSAASDLEDEFINTPGSLTKLQSGFGFTDSDPPRLAISRDLLDLGESIAKCKCRELGLETTKEAVHQNRVGYLCELGVKTYLWESLDIKTALPRSQTCEYDVTGLDDNKFQIKGFLRRQPDLWIPAYQDLASDYYIACECTVTDLIICGFATHKTVANAPIKPSPPGYDHDNRVVKNDDLRPISQLSEVVSHA